MIFRFAPATSTVNMITQVRTVLGEMKGLTLEGTAFESAELAAEGSEVFLPVDFGAPITSNSSTAATVNDEYGRYVNFVGRTTGGSRVAFYLFNVYRNTGTANNRLTVTENAVVGTVLPTLAGSGINLVGIDQNPFVMKSYANTGINDAVAKKARALA
jgi:hypothetical protein